MWGFPATILDGDSYTDHTTISDDNKFYFEGSLMHELGHARYLIDVYGFNVSADQVDINENGVPVALSEYMPDLNWGVVYYVPVLGLMNGQYSFIDSYSAGALNQIAGHRAINGNYNAPYNIGEFLQDLPDENILEVNDLSGHPLVGTSVRVYQATGQAGVWYGKHFDDVADQDLVTDENGEVLLGRCPFSDSGVITHYWELCNSVVILRLAHGGTIDYEFLPALEFNEAYWRGDTDVAHYTMAIDATTDVNETPRSVTLLSNRPNPFNPQTDITFTLARETPVTLTIHDAGGRRLVSLFKGVLPTGAHVVSWDGRDEDGRDVSSGTYFCRLTGTDHAEILKMTLIR